MAAGFSADVLIYADESIEMLFGECYRAAGCVCLVPEADRSKTLSDLITQIGAMGVKSADTAEGFLAILQEAKV